MNPKFDEEYYLILRKNDDRYPTIDGNIEIKNRFFDLNQKIEGNDDVIVNLNIMLSNGENDEFVDYHSSGGDSICSLAFADFINDLNVRGVQFLKGTQGTIIDEFNLEYYFMHVYNRIACVNREKSNLKVNPRTGNIKSIKSFSLNSQVLEKIPLEKRLIFFLDESAYIKLFHQSIVDKIIKTDLKGFQFVKVSDWSIHHAFK